MSTDLVAVIGRPNVGKSTLFNRIIGAQHAIVHGEPGVTRDRHYGMADWCGKRFTVIDTGGFVPDSDDLFEKAIREQTRIAIDEADTVVFVVDARDGITGIDREIARILRKSSKKIILAVNKVDSDGFEITTAEFHSLGLGEPFSIAALGGRKIGDFLDALTKEMAAEADEEKEDKYIRLAVIGKPNVGKSSLVNALIGKERTIVTPIAGTTRDSIDTHMRYQDEDLVLVDTAGLVKRSKVKESIEFYSAIRTLKSLERCSVAVVLFDATEGIEKQDLRIVQSAVERNRGIIIGVNKWDLIEKDTYTAIEYEKAIRKKLRTYDFIPIVFISAVTRQRIFKLIDQAKMVHRERAKRVPTAELNEKILKEIQNHPPSTRTGKDVRIKFVTQVKAPPPIFTFFAGEPQLINETYRRFLENRIRDHFGFVGVPLTLQFRKKSRKEIV